MDIVTTKDVKLTLLPIGDHSIELLQPIGMENRFARHLRERGEGLFHISIFTEDFDKEINALKAKGFELEEEVVSQLFKGFNVRLAWIPPKETTGLWIELVDSASLPPDV